MNLAIGAWDLAILAAYLVAVVLFGLWMGRGQRNLSDYFLGGRHVPWWVILGSIVATETSTVTFLSVPGIAFAHERGDLRFLQLVFGFVLGRCLVVVLFLPHYFRGDLFTAYEVLDRRFGGATKEVASLLFLGTRTLADGLRLYLTAIVLAQVAGFDLAVCIVIIGVVTVAYTFVGGMRSVVWNDCVQFLVYIGGAVLAGIIILEQLPGGWSELMTFAQVHHKFQLFDLSFNLSKSYTLWSGLIGGAFLSLATHGTDQLMVQRYLCAGSQREAGRALIWSGLVVFGQFALFLGLGVGLACFYAHFPPASPFQNTDEVFASFIVNHLPVGVVGITLAAVFSAAMSTLSSSLNSSATAFINDIYLPRSRRDPESDAGELLKLGRTLTVVFGVLQIGVGIAGARLSESVISSVLAIAGFTTGIVLGVFFLGVFTKRASQKAALFGLLGGLAGMTGIAFGTSLAWPWYTVVGSTLTFGLGAVAGAVLPDKRQSVGG